MNDLLKKIKYKEIETHTVTWSALLPLKNKRQMLLNMWDSQVCGHLLKNTCIRFHHLLLQGLLICLNSTLPWSYGAIFANPDIISDLRRDVSKNLDKK